MIALAAEVQSCIERESDLFIPVRDYLLRHGYTVRSEVLGCDITATRDDDLIIIELKRRLSLELVAQTALRQRATNSVYLAVPRQKNQRGGKWRSVLHVLRRLELGLLIISVSRRKHRVEAVLHPQPFQRRKQPKQRRALLQEIAGRSADHNIAGSNRRKLVTAYRESALIIAAHLKQHNTLSPRKLRELGSGAKTQSILYDNMYGWFERVGRGTYRLTLEGHEALEVYREVLTTL